MHQDPRWAGSAGSLPMLLHTVEPLAMGVIRCYMCTTPAATFRGSIFFCRKSLSEVKLLEVKVKDCKEQVLRISGSQERYVITVMYISFKALASLAYVVLPFDQTYQSLPDKNSPRAIRKR